MAGSYYKTELANDILVNVTAGQDNKVASIGFSCEDLAEKVGLEAAQNTVRDLAAKLLKVISPLGSFSMEKSHAPDGVVFSPGNPKRGNILVHCSRLENPGTKLDESVSIGLQATAIELKAAGKFGAKIAAPANAEDLAAHILEKFQGQTVDSKVAASIAQLALENSQAR